MASMTTSSLWSPFQFNNVSTPLSNINSNLVNTTNSNYPGNFSSNETNRQYGMSGVSSNVTAANSSIMKGGKPRKTLRRKIKNIVNKYKKMRYGRKSRKMTLRRLKNRFASISRRGKSKKSVSRRRSKRQRGGTGYHQYMGNVPSTPTYSTGGILPANESALANPVPFKQLSNCTNCVDNYNHNTNNGYQLW